MLPALHTQQVAYNSVNYEVENGCNVHTIGWFHILLLLVFWTSVDSDAHGYKGVLYPSWFAKYLVAFFSLFRSSVFRFNSAFNFAVGTDSLDEWSMVFITNWLAAPVICRFSWNTKPFSDFLNRVPSLCDLLNCFNLEFFGIPLAFAHKHCLCKVTLEMSKVSSKIYKPVVFIEFIRAFYQGFRNLIINYEYIINQLYLDF